VAKTDDKASGARFDIAAVASELPADADTMLADIYLRDCPDSSARLFRVYRPVPAHFHQTCDEYLYVVSGRGTFWMGSAAEAEECRPGQLICFTRNTVHAIPEILEAPLVFMAIDAPRRHPTDIVFVDPKDGTPATFMARNAATA
jgi:mannose-6-phosphate isomerase-like protein (cupin superfamily)